MKSLIEYIEDITDKQTDTDIQLAELISNQEYTACLIEMQTME